VSSSRTQGWVFAVNLEAHSIGYLHDRLWLRQVAETAY
jgi:hypothetical protein